MLEQDQSDLQDAIASRGFAFVEVDLETDLRRNAQEADIIFSIREGSEVYVERIDIEGNLRTLDKVVRREFRLSEGSPYDRSAVRRSQQRIRNLGYFRSVELSEEPGGADDRVILRTQVEEQPTGGLFFGLGYATESKFSGRARITEDNLLGTGRQIALSTSIASSTSDVDLSYTQPYFLDRRLLVGGDLFRVRSEFESSDYNRTRTGAALRAGYDISDYTRHVLRYSLRLTEIDITGDKPPASIKEEDPRAWRSSISQTITYDRRDSRLNPTEGHFVELFNDYTGLGGDVNYIRSTLAGGKYFPIRRNRARPTRTVLWVRGEAGFIEGLGENTTSSDRFFLGGRTLRGFDFYGIGPREVNGLRAIGGKYYYKATAQLDFPVGLPEELNVLGFLYSDAGTLFGYDSTATECFKEDGTLKTCADGDERKPIRVHDKRSLRAAVGGGFFWRSPLGPLSFTWSRPVSKEPYDVTETFLFSIGTEF